MQVNIGQLLYSLKDIYAENEDIRFFCECAGHIKYSQSQNFQDIFALHENDFKFDGFYVEFGATDGVEGSNSYMLHQQGWNGIVAEPNTTWHERLKANRESKRTTILTDCVYTESGKTLDFLAVADPALSTITGFGMNDEHSSARQNNKVIKVNTISLYDMLTQYAPNQIDYMSVDTEGSEYEILKAFFEKNDRFDIKCITVEHNNIQENRDNLYKLLTSHGYDIKFQAFSRWDDFYVKRK